MTRPTSLPVLTNVRRTQSTDQCQSHHRRDNTQRSSTSINSETNKVSNSNKTKHNQTTDNPPNTQSTQQPREPDPPTEPLNLQQATAKRRNRRQGRHQRKRKQTKKNRITPGHKHQLKITNFIRNQQLPDDGTGNSIDEPKDPQNLRIFLQNPSGVLVGKEEINDLRTLRQIKTWDVDIIALPETNKNWNQPWLREKWSRTVKRVWKHAKIYTSTIKTAPTNEHYVQGGVSLIVTDKWSSRITGHGSDELGRWAWITLKGRRDQKITILTLYRSQRGSPHDGKLEAVWTQQYQHLLTKKLSQESLESIRDPREQCLTDLKDWIKSHITQDSHKLIIATDANQTTSETTKQFSLKQLISSTNLQSILDNKHHGQQVPSTTRGTQVIDHLLTKYIPMQNVKKIGQLAHGLGFPSNHRALFSDIDTIQTLGLRTDAPTSPPARRLVSKNLSTNSEYITELIRQLEAHNIFERTAELITQARSGSLTETQKKTYETLDETISQAMLSAESKLPNRRRNEVHPSYLPVGVFIS